jgi:hypothetical protein
VSRTGVDWSTNKVIPLGTYTESPYLGTAYPPHVSVLDHLSIYKYGSVAILAIFPLVLTTKLFPAVGGLALLPVVQ